MEASAVVALDQSSPQTQSMGCHSQQCLVPVIQPTPMITYCTC